MRSIMASLMTGQSVGWTEVSHHLLDKKNDNISFSEDESLTGGSSTLSSFTK